MPRCLMTGTYEPTSAASLVAITPSGEVIAIATGKSVQFYNATNGTFEGSIEDMCSGKLQVCLLLMMFSKISYLFSFRSNHRTSVRLNGQISAGLRRSLHPHLPQHTRVQSGLRRCRAKAETAEDVRCHARAHRNANRRE